MAIDTSNVSDTPVADTPVDPTPLPVPTPTPTPTPAPVSTTPSFFDRYGAYVGGAVAAAIVLGLVVEFAR